MRLKTDRQKRRFGFRATARQVMDATPPEQRAIVEAYARGVNAGVASLESRPWEYLLLRAQPREWLPEDSVLVVHSMWWQLQWGPLRDELDRRRVERALAKQGDDVAAHTLVTFIWAGHSDWDTPNYGKEAPCVQAACTQAASVLSQPFPSLLKFSGSTKLPDDEAAKPGSNSWAVAGTYTRSGVALDRQRHAPRPGRARGVVPGASAHDGLAVAGRHRRDPARDTGRGRRVEWSDCLGLHQQLRRFLRRALGQVRDGGGGYAERIETIKVKGRDDVRVTYHDLTAGNPGAGVVLDGEDYADDVKSGECLQAAWLAARADGDQLRTAVTGARAHPRRGAGAGAGHRHSGPEHGRRRFRWAHRLDLLGRVPRGTRPDRLFGSVEFRDAVRSPAHRRSAGGRLWTANQRVVAGELEGVMGDDEVDVGAGGYDIGARARQIRDDLLVSPAGHRGRHARHPAGFARGVPLRWRNLLPLAAR